MNLQQTKYLTSISDLVCPASFREIVDCVSFKKLIRLEILTSEIERFGEAIKNLNLNFSVSGKYFSIPTDKGMDIWASALIDCSDSEPNAIQLVYLHSDKDICNRAKLLDENDDDFNLGLAFQYPKCCIDAYCNWQTDNEDIDPITTITSAFSFDGELRFHNFPNPFSRYFGLGLYSHFPCSLTCEKTRQIAKKSLDNLQIHFPKVADRLIQHENSFVIFKKEKGICIWEEFSVEGNRIKLNNESIHGQGKLKEELKGIDLIELNESSLFIFSKDRHRVEFKTKDCFIGAFGYLANAKKTHS